MMMKDHIVDEVRKNRTSNAEKFQFNIRDIVADVQKRQDKNRLVNFEHKKAS